jgi:hypothetical protein
MSGAVVAWAETREQVREFQPTAGRLGAEVLEVARLFTEYRPTYFAVFVRDPDGHRIDAVSHTLS